MAHGHFLPFGGSWPRRQLAGDLLPRGGRGWLLGQQTQAPHTLLFGLRSLTVARSGAVETGIIWWAPSCHQSLQSQDREQRLIVTALSPWLPNHNSYHSHISVQGINRKAKLHVFCWHDTPNIFEALKTKCWDADGTQLLYFLLLVLTLQPSSSPQTPHCNIPELHLTTYLDTT